MCYRSDGVHVLVCAGWAGLGCEDYKDADVWIAGSMCGGGSGLTGAIEARGFEGVPPSARRKRLKIDPNPFWK